MYINERARRG